MSPEQAARTIDALLAHVWMVRAFLKHSDEAVDDEGLQEIQRMLYDYHLAVGGPWAKQDWTGYLHLARKKFSRLRQASEELTRLGPEVSTHTNFAMAAASLAAATEEIGKVLEEMKNLPSAQG